ncbi:MAG: hypothetical protein U1G07_19010 [Verrucomicrobiota bacterium]
MPKPTPQVKPVVKPSLTVLVVLSLVLLGAGLALLSVGRTQQQNVAAFLCLALLASTVTFGLLGATGMVKTRRWQLSGSAGVFVAILSLLLPFARNPGKGLDGTVFLDDLAVPEATVVLLHSGLAAKHIRPEDHGEFHFPATELKKEYTFEISIPNLRATNVTVQATGGWLSVKVYSKGLAQGIPPGQPAPDPILDKLKLCRPDTNVCTFLVFDYLNNEIDPAAVNEFHNSQSDRLEKAIRSSLGERHVLDTIKFRVRRCTEATIRDATLASTAVATLQVPAVMWGFIGKSPTADRRLVSTTRITLLDPPDLSVATREELGEDVTELIGRNLEVKGPPVAIAALVVGDVHLKNGRPELARKAFLIAQELIPEIPASDREDFRAALQSRLDKVDASNAAAGLRPIGEPPG